MRTLADVASNKTIPVAFMSRQMKHPQQNTWTMREMEAYAVVSALEKWARWIGDHPVPVLTNHRTLEALANETRDDPMGPSCGRARWHLMLGCTQGKDHVDADGLNRWAYPASQVGPNVCWLATQHDLEAMENILAEKKMRNGQDGLLCAAWD